MSASVEYASISISSQGTPESSDFGDVYFSRNDGIAETTYVFLQQNSLESRWCKLSDNDLFVIAETGFGSGLSFLLSWQLFEQVAVSGARLHFVSFEKFPIKPTDLERIHQQWPELEGFCKTLQRHYPPPLKGIHRLHLSERVTLDLCFGDVNDLVPDWSAANQGQVHAWFLDGFAPGKNPDMWSDSLYRCIFESMAPSATLSTFTATGNVRRGLQRAGIRMQKIKGFGQKRNMLRGSKHSLASPDYRRVSSKEHLTIIGGGIAGASLAMRLKDHKGPLTILIKGTAPADGASGNPQGAVYPLLQAQWNNVSEFYSHCFLYARKFYQETIPDACFWGGVQLLGHSPETIRRFRELAKSNYPGALFRLLTNKQASRAANYPHRHCAALLPEAGWVEPVKLVQSLIAETVAYRSAKGLSTSIQSETEVTSLKQTGSRWQVCVSNGKTARTFHADHVLLASGSALTSLLPEPLVPIRPAQGQIIQVKSEQLSSIKQMLCHKGYAAPEQNELTTLGSTFNKGSWSTEISAADSEEILKVTNQSLGTSLQLNDIFNARASVRATTPDHLPVIGAVPITVNPTEVNPSLATAQGLWVLCGLGARGFTSAPWSAELLVSQLYGQPLPCGEKLLKALSPSRFALRALRRNKPLTELK